jgi:ubiquitin carboxyl-terminal hydrolase 5/13
VVQEEEATVIGDTIVFNDKIFEFHYALVCLPHGHVWPLPESRNDLPMKVVQVIDAIIQATSAEKKEDIKTFQDNSILMESKFARTLITLDNGRKIAPHGWVCDVEGCGKNENLWLNLSDGHIGCGRKNFDGSGGNGHALDHFKQSGFPLAVKLGTITPDGTADVYSYDPSEDDMVKDPLLEEHLAHWGIDMKEMKKTDKSVAELSLDMSRNFDWSRIQESDKKLAPVFGPGFTGLANLGNSCYMNSIMQVLFSIPEFQNRYAANTDKFFRAAQNPPRDFFVQMAKLGYGLVSGEYSKPPVEGAKVELDDATAPRPVLFKALIGEGHREFGTARQQDALEYFQYFMDFIERQEHNVAKGGDPQSDPSKIFAFRAVERVECTSSHKVKYSENKNNVLSLPIPVERATNYAEYAAYRDTLKALPEAERKVIEANQEGIVRPHVRLQECLESFASAEVIANFYSTAIKDRTVALKTTRFGTFPEYLVIQMRKFYVDTGSWIPKKLDVILDVPDELDLEWLRSHGKKPEEELLPEEDKSAPAAPAKPQYNEEVVAMLVAMDIPRVRAERASHATMGQPADAAMDWLFSHLEDADIDKPLPAPSSGAAPAGPAVNPEFVMMLTSMGFTDKQATKALKECGGDAERAADWLFSRADSLDTMDVDEPAPGAKAGAEKKDQNLKDGPAKYRLFAMVSHMGTSTMSGHYVCHIHKDGKWIIYNDANVAISENPPRDLAYLYVYKRV